MKSEIEEIKQKGVLKTEIENNEVVVTIVKQMEYNFEIMFYEKNGVITKERPGEFDRRIKIGSINVVDYVSREREISFFLKGDMDRSERYKKVNVPLEDWDVVKQCLEMAGFVVDPTEETIEAEKITVELGDSFGEPSDEEIEKMISLVDVKTFGLILKNRLFREGTASKDEIVKKITDKFVKEYLKKWAVSKYRFYKIFGDKLMIEKIVEVAPDEHSVRSEIEDLLNDFPLYSPIFDAVNSRAIAQNKVDHSEMRACFFNDKKVKDGMKFTKFISLFGNKDLDMALSKVYQNLGKCKITISIDPIDYLTVSVNNSGWKSCHNFFDGCYRNATLSYLNDETSLVSYSSGKKVRYSMELPFEWYSKKWRQMIYVSKNSSTTVFSRQYPNSCEQIATEIRGLFEETFSNCFNVENKWKVFKNVNSLGVEVKNGSRLVYNDVANGYDHKVIQNTCDCSYGNSDVIKIGDKVKAMNVGDLTGGEDYLW